MCVRALISANDPDVSDSRTLNSEYTKEKKYITLYSLFFDTAFLKTYKSAPFLMYLEMQIYRLCPFSLILIKTLRNIVGDVNRRVR